MGAPLALIRDLDNSIENSSDMRRAAMLRQLTDLYLVGAEQYSEQEIDLIDEVFLRLVVTIEESSRALLAIRLGPVAKAPPRIMRMLACDDAIDVASPVLTQSEQLDTVTLIKCAKTKSQEHMLAISRRASLPEVVTDVLVARGDQQVVLSTASNAGARFSQQGFGILVDRSRGDDHLVQCVGKRADLPPQLFVKLVEAASHEVRARLIAERQHSAQEIDRVIGEVGKRIGHAAVTRTPLYAAAQILVESLQAAGDLDRTALEGFARAGRLEEIVAGLALMTRLPTALVEQAVHDQHAEMLLVLAKAVGLPWLTTKLIVGLIAKRYERPIGDLDHLMAAFERLKPAVAKQILDFHRSRAGVRRTN
jgi:uncharacterized protein (DUF2336 family)